MPVRIPTHAQRNRAQGTEDIQPEVAAGSQFCKRGRYKVGAAIPRAIPRRVSQGSAWKHKSLGPWILISSLVVPEPLLPSSVIHPHFHNFCVRCQGCPATHPEREPGDCLHAKAWRDSDEGGARGQLPHTLSVICQHEFQLAPSCAQIVSLQVSGASFFLPGVALAERPPCISNDGYI